MKLIASREAGGEGFRLKLAPHELAVPERDEDRDLRIDLRLPAIRSTLASEVDALAESVAKNRTD